MTTDQWDAPLQPGTCPWCSATNLPDARQCRSCGAAIAQRDDLGGVVVPGVTGVDPNLVGAEGSLAGTLLRNQGTANALHAATQVNSTLGLAAAAAILGQDMVRDALGLHDADLSAVGKPSEAAVRAAEQLDREPTTADTDGDDREASSSADEPSTPAPATDPWADLPNG